MNENEEVYESTVPPVTSREREIGLNTMLNIIARYDSTALEAVTVDNLIAQADKLAQYIASGNLPDGV